MANPAYTFTTFDAFRTAYSTKAWGINDAGEISGRHPDNVNGPYHGIIDISGKFTTSAYSTDVYGINNAGELFGAWSNSANGPTFGFAYENGDMASIDVPDALGGAWGTVPVDTNDRGQVVGGYHAGSISHGLMLIIFLVLEISLVLMRLV